ncbi:MAG: NTE family protein RssA [Smithella sp. PtaU1.Bin162]|nr:MAG: NTE family protein RssA [Smithella sp. PtaU1.Bin162]
MITIISHYFGQRAKIILLPAIIFILSIFLMSFEVRAGEPGSPARPKIGLVLSGGGARGVAHIGVIKVLEEMKIPVDYIAGTSMGAIIGGLYASGISPADLEKIVTSIEWNEAFKDNPSPQDLSFRRKQDAADYMIDFDIGYKDGSFKIPRGFIQGQNLHLILKKLLFHTESIRNFDELHIPFRAVAADIETGETVVLKDGSLVKAIRASMSIPGVFSPVEIDGRLLVDGGIADNVPVDIARQMGADCLIVVDIGTGLRSRDKLVSAVSISAQVMTIMIQRNSQAQIRTLTAKDVLIQPQLGTVGSSDFSRATESIGIGKAGAVELKEKLARFSVPENDFLAYLHHQRKEPQDLPRIDFVAIANKSELDTKVIEAQIKTKPGDKLNMKTLEEDIKRTYGIGTFEAVDFRLERKDKESGIVIEPIEKAWGPNYLRFGLSLEDNFKGSSNYTISTRFTKTAINSRGAEWRTELQIGETPRVYSEFYQPIDYAMDYFVAAGVEYKVHNINSFNAEGDITTQYRVSAAQVGFDVGRQFGNWGEFRFGIRRERGDVGVRIGDPSPGSVSFNRGSLYSSFAYSTLDNYSFPLGGSDANIVWMYNLEQLGSDIEVQGLAAHWLTAKTWGKNTIVPAIRIQTVLGNDESPIQDSFSLGGFLNLSGYSANEISGRHTAVISLLGYRKLGSAGLGVFNMPLYLGVSAEAGNVWDRKSDITFNSLIYAGSVFIGTTTYLGPIFLAYGQAEGGHQSVYLFLGQRF